MRLEISWSCHVPKVPAVNTHSAMRTKPQTVTGWEGFPGAKCSRLTEAAPPALYCVSRARSELVEYSQY